MSLLLAAALLLNDEKISKAMSDLTRFRAALGAYEVDNGVYPTTKQGLGALLNPPDDARGWKGPYLEGRGLLLDPWGNSYLYRSPGEVFPNGYDLFSAGPDGKPGTDDDVPVLNPKKDKDGADLVRKAVETTKAQKSFEATYKARYSPPKGDNLDYQGRQVWVAPGILYMGLTGSGGMDKKIIRAGNDVWVYTINGWDTAAGSGDDGAARGIQHPLEILDIVGHQAAAAKRTKTGATILLSGDDLQAALKNHLQGNSVAWQKSTAQVDLSLDADGRLKTLSCNASLLSNNPNLPGKFQYTMEVSIVGFNTVTELKFMDGKDRPIVPGTVIQARIAQLLEGGK